MADYPAGSLKWNPASRSVAIRTDFPEIGSLADHAWLVATTGSGAISKTSADVVSWIDVPLPADPAVIDAELLPDTPALSA